MRHTVFFQRILKGAKETKCSYILECESNCRAFCQQVRKHWLETEWVTATGPPTRMTESKKLQTKQEMLYKLFTCLELNIEVCCTLQQGIVNGLFEDFQRLNSSLSCNQSLSEMRGLKQFQLVLWLSHSAPIHAQTFHRGHHPYHLVNRSSQEPQRKTLKAVILLGFTLSLAQSQKPDPCGVKALGEWFNLLLRSPLLKIYWQDLFLTLRERDFSP